MRRLLLQVAVAMLIAGCARSGGVVTGGEAPPSGPVTQLKDPAAVYAGLRPTLTYEAEDLVAARQVEFVSMRGFNRNAGRVQLNRPLWGDQNEKEIAHLLALLRQHGASDASCSGDSQVLIRFKDRAEQCFDPRAAFSNQDLRGLMPPIAPVTAEPSVAAPGETITVRGEGWVGGAGTVTLTLRDGDGRVFHLADVPLERGRFTWTGALPAAGVTVPPWHYVNLLATVEGIGTGDGNLSLSYKR